MKKIISLLMTLSFYTHVDPCSHYTNLKKAGVILESIARRIQKHPHDFLEQEIKNSVDLFTYEYKNACVFCKLDAERYHFHLIDFLTRHMKIYKLI